MANRRRLNLQKFGISPERYDELRAFCLQYEEWKDRLREIRQLAATEDNGGERLGRFNPTERAALKATEYTNKILIVEKALKTVVGAERAIYEKMLKHITQGVTFEKLELPMSRVDFYNSRTAFFVNLDKLV